MNVFEEKVVMTVIELKFVCQTSSIVFFPQKCTGAIFYALFNWQQIVTDTCK